jgi:DNA-binding NtrC family response regulator
VISLKMPPLRERKGDISVLCEHFLKDLAHANGKAVKPLGEDALPALMAYDWPGNVRELRTVIEHGVVMSNSPRIMLKHLPGYLSGSGGAAAPRLASASADPAIHVASELPTDLNLERMERRFIEEALRRTGNNRTLAAELLGLSRRTMQRKLAEMDMLIRKSRS